jgi:hypothetical protein
VVDHALRAQSSLAPGIGVQLAAAAGAIALALVNQSQDVNAIAIFSAGSRDDQYRMLSRIGLRQVSGIEPLTTWESTRCSAYRYSIPAEPPLPWRVSGTREGRLPG